MWLPWTSRSKFSQTKGETKASSLKTVTKRQLNLEIAATVPLTPCEDWLPRTLPKVKLAIFPEQSNWSAMCRGAGQKQMHLAIALANKWAVKGNSNLLHWKCGACGQSWLSFSSLFIPKRGLTITIKLDLIWRAFLSEKQCQVNLSELVCFTRTKNFAKTCLERRPVTAVLWVRLACASPCTNPVNSTIWHSSCCHS